MQRLIVTGRITKDLELRYAPNNEPVLILPVAVINTKKDAKPLYLDFIVYGESAKTHIQYLFKGCKILIEGHISQSVKEVEGKKVKKDSYYIDRIEYLENKKQKCVSGEQVANQVVENMTKVQSDPFAEFGEEIQLSDDDLPF